MHTDPWMPGLRQQRITVDDGVEINAWVGGQGPALLLVHGHPQTSAIWHRVAPRLAQQFTVVLADLRGYGDSSRPAGDPEHANYSKRTMARDLLRLMARLGHEHFSVLAHDRGARVAHRLAMDYPASVQRLVLLDIAPTLAMYEQTGEAFARAYWHWFFLIQPAPLPERLIEADPAAYVREIMGRRSAGLAPFDPRALAEYQRCLALPGSAHGMCEDYRASAGIDLDHDRASRALPGNEGKIACNMLVIWGERGVVQRMFQPVPLWQAQCAGTVSGKGLPAGHFIPEELPSETAQCLADFFLPKSQTVA